MLVHLSVEGLAILQIVVAFGLPTIVAYVTDSRARKAVKTWSLIVLSAVSSVLTSLLATSDFDLKQVALSFFGILLAAVAAHKGVTSNLGLSGADSAPAETGLHLGSPART